MRIGKRVGQAFLFFLLLLALVSIAVMVLKGGQNRNNLFSYEIYLIINGVKRGLSTDEILEKYGIMTNIPNGPLIKPGKKDCNDIIISIDGNKTFLRDDGLSVRKDGNKYIVGIINKVREIKYKSLWEIN